MGVDTLLQLSTLAGLLVAASGLVVTPGCSVHSSHGTAASPFACSLGGLHMQAEDAPLRDGTVFEEPAAAEGVADAAAGDSFTEDLLDALAADEAPLSGSSAALDAAQPISLSFDDLTLDPALSYSNNQLVEDARSAYKLHENDTGSATVQIAVLSARITYMTAHMQKNKKDYASLRGLTKMVTRRRKLLEYMLKHDIEEFKRVTSALGIRTNKLLKPKLSGARGRRI